MLPIVRLLFVLPIIAVASGVSTVLCGLLFSHISARAWANLFYCRWFVFLAFATSWSAVLLPIDRRALTDWVASRPVFALLARLAALGVVAALLVSLTDVAFEWTGSSAVVTMLQGEVIWKRAWATNSLVLFAFYALAFALSGRVVAALIAVSPVYIALVIANLAQLKYMDVAVQPLDLARLPEFLPYFRDYFGTAGLLGALATAGLWPWALWRAVRGRRREVTPAARAGVGITAGAVLVALLVAFADSSWASSQRLLLAAGAPPRGYTEHVRRYGLLLNFLSNLPAAFVSRPPSYSRAAVERAFARTAVVTDRRGPAHGRPNLVLYMLESMMDPDDFNVQYTADAIPTVRSLRNTYGGGWAIVPEAFSGSVNTEFESLTGMSMCFLPKRSLAYRQYLRYPIPSLPRALRAAGYRTSTIQLNPRQYFGRERAYALLGFDEVRWLDEVPGIERTARDGSPSDRAVVDAILEVATSGRREPFFVFAFPASTHAPYHQGTYRNSPLTVTDPLPDAVRLELQEYLNALQEADRALARLIERFRDWPSPTMIVVLGDHLPPVSGGTREVFARQLARMSPAERALRSRRVPLAVWANYPLPKQTLEFSTNALPSYILEQLDVPPAGFLALTDAVRRTVPILGDRVTECGWGSQALPPLDPATQMLVDDYRLLSYDLLVGRRYSDAATSPAGGLPTH